MTRFLLILFVIVVTQVQPVGDAMAASSGLDPIVLVIVMLVIVMMLLARWQG